LTVGRSFPHRRHGTFKWAVKEAVDPEEMLIAVLSNCHMLSFLHVARLAGFASRPIRHAVALDTRRSVAQTRRDTLHLARGSETMPEIYVHAIEGRSKEQKRALIKDITDAVVKNFGVGADAVLVEIIETSRDNKAKGGVLFSER
jgi:4-oxalocrotonate tautomerase